MNEDCNPVEESFRKLFDKLNTLSDEIGKANLLTKSFLRCWEFTDCPPEVMRKCIVVLQNADRQCWLLVGTLSGVKDVAPCAVKAGDCRNCGFYQNVNNREQVDVADRVEAVKVLVVEDENIVALEIKDRLKRLGYAVCGVVAFGEQAVEEAREKHPDLVLMDIRLKGKMDGVEAAGIIQRESDIPVVFLTANSDDPTFLRAKLTNPFGFVLKPFHERELKTSVDLALYKHKTAQADARLRQREKTLERAKTEVITDSNDKSVEALDEIIGAARRILNCASEQERSECVAGIVAQAEALRAKMMSAAGMLSADINRLMDESRRINKGDLKAS